MIKIDGSLMEGGGSIVRNAIALSAILNKPVEIFNIRAKRSKPGLRNQHMYVIKSIGEMCDAKIKGASVGSNKIEFIPNKIKAGEYKVDVQTAGSLTLLLQALIPVAAHADSTVKLLLKGGTDVPMAPPLDYLRFVYQPTMNDLGLDIIVCAGRRGHYPKGGGTLSCDIEPKLRMKPLLFQFEQSTEAECVYGKAHAVKLPAHIAERMIASATELLENKGLKISTFEQETPEPKYDTHVGPGTGITLWAKTNNNTIIAGDCLGKRGLPAEDVGRIAAKNLLEQLVTKRPVDYHLADQLIIWMALSDYPSVIDTTKITLHTLTNIEIIKQFTNASFTVVGSENNPGTISCEPNIL